MAHRISNADECEITFNKIRCVVFQVKHVKNEMEVFLCLCVQTSNLKQPQMYFKVTFMQYASTQKIERQEQEINVSSTKL